jgi:ferredoxin/flavodoxin
MFMIGLYFSGTGNTKYCVTEFVKCFDKENTAVPIEYPEVKKLVDGHDIIVFGYPVYFSNTPKIVTDFIESNPGLFSGKRVFIIATMGLFSGDGSGCAARLLKKCGADIAGGLHLKMPDCIGDVKLLKKTLEQNRRIVTAAEKKTAAAVKKLNDGVPPHTGLNPVSRVAGLLTQRLWFYKETASYKKKPNIDRLKCFGCGRCVELCPMNNLTVREGKAVSGSRCTMCYRCFSHCPAQALTIIGKQVHEQCTLEGYRN